MKTPRQVSLDRVPHPSGRDKVRRAIWQILYLLLFRPSPIPLHAFRASILRLFGAKVGKKCLIYPDSRIWAPWNLTLADGVTVGQRVFLYSVAPISIGRNGVVSWDAVICTATHDHRTDFMLITGPVTVGANAWIAAQAFVGPGVVIGSNAIVGACAVVFRDVAESEIMAGNPAVRTGLRPAQAENNLRGTASAGGLGLKNNLPDGLSSAINLERSQS